MLAKIREYGKYVFPFVLGVLIYAFITNFQETKALFSSVASGIGYVFGRFFIGFGLAYLLDYFVEWAHRRLRFPRWLGIAVSYTLLLGLLTCMLIYILPLIAESLTRIVSLVQQVTQATPDWLLSLARLLDLDPQDVAFVMELVGDVTANLTGYLKSLISYPTVESLVRASTRVLLNLSFGLLISLYALIEKQALLAQVKKMTTALFSAKRANAAIAFAHESHKIFSHFLIGKALDSLIIGILSAIIYAIFRVPMTPFLALVAGVTNMIPYFGPFIGGVITVFIMFCFDPMYALYTLIIVVGVQTLDATVIGPRVLSGAVGISPLLTIVTITIGGDIGGLLGIFLGVPISAVLKTVVYDNWLARKLAARDQETQSPDDNPPPEPTNEPQTG